MTANSALDCVLSALHHGAGGEASLNTFFHAFSASCAAFVIVKLSEGRFVRGRRLYRPFMVLTALVFASSDKSMSSDMVFVAPSTSSAMRPSRLIFSAPTWLVNVSKSLPFCSRRAEIQALILHRLPLPALRVSERFPLRAVRQACYQRRHIHARDLPRNRRVKILSVTCHVIKLRLQICS